MEEIIKYVEDFRMSIDVKQCDTRTYNSYRLAGILVKKLKAKQPFSKDDLTEGMKKSL